MEKVLTPKFRVSFPHLFTPNLPPGAKEPKYSIAMLFPKDTDLSQLKQLAKEAIEKKWPDATKRPKPLRSPFRDGDIEKPNLQGYPGHIFINASSKMLPGLVDQKRQPIIDGGDFYAGCYARASLTAYAYDTAGNRGVAFGLQNVQKLADGESFTGRTKAEDDFTDVAESSDFANQPPTANAADDPMFK